MESNYKYKPQYEKLIVASTKILATMLAGFAAAVRETGTNKNEHPNKRPTYNYDNNIYNGGNEGNGYNGDLMKPSRNSNLSTNIVTLTGKTLSNLARSLVDSYIPIFERTVTGRYAQMSPEEASKNLNNMLKRQTDLLVKISNDDELMNLIEKWAKLNVNIGLQIITTIRPSLNNLLVEFWKAVDAVFSKSIIAAINTSLNVGKAAVSTIPVAGGGIILLMSFFEGLNQGLLAAAPGVKSGTSIAMAAPRIGSKIISDIFAKTKDAREISDKLKSAFNESVPEEVERKIEDAGREVGIKTMESLQNNSQRDADFPVTTVGGRKQIVKNRSLKNKIQQSRRRLRKTILNFTTRQNRLRNVSTRKKIKSRNLPRRNLPH